MTGLLFIVDHASNDVPADIDLGIDPALLDTHIAWDIGAESLARALRERLGGSVLAAAVSRLVIDLNREEDAASLIPVASDGVTVPGNAGLSEAQRAARIDRFWRPWHDSITAALAADRPALLVSLHSFTPTLASDPDRTRPWEVGVLYNRDDRAARIALPLLEAADIVTGDNQPYSGRDLNATMNRHGEGNGLPYLGLEVRQDLIDHDAGVAHWAARLAPVIEGVQSIL